MSWILFIVGLLFGLIIGPIAFFVWLLRGRSTQNIQVQADKQLQEKLGQFLLEARDRETLHVYQRGEGPKIRVIKYARKTKHDALMLEIRRTENEAHYQELCEGLRAIGIAYQEQLTKQRRDSKSIRIKIDETDEGVAERASTVIHKAYEAIHSKSALDL